MLTSSFLISSFLKLNIINSRGLVRLTINSTIFKRIRVLHYLRELGYYMIFNDWFIWIFLVVIVEHFCCSSWRSWPTDLMSIHIANKMMLYNFKKHWLSNYFGLGLGKKLRSVPLLKTSLMCHFLDYLSWDVMITMGCCWYLISLKLIWHHTCFFLLSILMKKKKIVLYNVCDVIEWSYMLKKCSAQIHDCHVVFSQILDYSWVFLNIHDQLVFALVHDCSRVFSQILDSSRVFYMTSWYLHWYMTVVGYFHRYSTAVEYFQTYITKWYLD